MSFQRRSIRAFSFTACAFFLWTHVAVSQGDTVDPKTDPIPLMRDVSYNETKPSDAPRVRYRLRKSDDKGTNVKEIIETSEGDVARLLSREDQPLTPEQEQAEADRLNNLYAHPEIQERRHKKEQEDSGRVDNFFKLLPDAFIFTYQGMVEGPGGPAYRLTFVPNPKFIPPNREAQVYAGMAGEVWIDQREKRLERFDAHLIKDVEFAWGFAARLYQGGTISVEQKDVGDGRWEATSMKLNLTGKILMVKNLTVKENETSTDFVEIPKGTDYRGAINILKGLPPPMK
jgi:hypothetical protein